MILRPSDRSIPCRASSPGSDTFTGFRFYSQMMCGTTTNIAADFGQVYAYSFQDGTDLAYVYDAGVNHVGGFTRVV